MEVMIIIFVLILMVKTCHSVNRRFIETFYLAENRALLNHVFQWKTVSSPVICGRDCSMDPQCASFNFQTNHVCLLNNASKAHSLNDFVEIQASAYYDDNLDTLSFSLSSTTSYSSCLELYQAGYRSNGIYTIYPSSLADGLQVYCDMETDGGGWIVFQRRQDGLVDFYRTWADYQSGFGDLQSEFWLGNDILRDLTGSGQWQLRVDMENWESNTAWASYGEFAVTGDKYTLHVGSYNAQSTAGDSLSAHNGYSFTTKDQDNDLDEDINCGANVKGAWWFGACFKAHLNGKYYPQRDVPNSLGILWPEWTGSWEYSLKKCSMKIRQAL
ncbi:microfibril-associated glycoprotein 4-like [Asterias rubens]|uniref:microfibril-associated glycoprotein 4-like n=1 Tax=Asterias rubens TaxID=7604 RepID=UPI001455A4AD|nr:microfibril-associated glycoprotein 4-like [Asterias rubens]